MERGHSEKSLWKYKRRYALLLGLLCCCAVVFRVLMTNHEAVQLVTSKITLAHYTKVVAENDELKNQVKMLIQPGKFGRIHPTQSNTAQSKEIVRLKRQIGMLVQQQRVGNSNGEQIPGATDAIDRWAVPPVALQPSDRCHIPPQCYELCCVVHACLVPI